MARNTSARSGISPAVNQEQAVINSLVRHVGKHVRCQKPTSFSSSQIYTSRAARAAKALARIDPSHFCPKVAARPGTEARSSQHSPGNLDLLGGHTLTRDQQLRPSLPTLMGQLLPLEAQLHGHEQRQFGDI